jgi:hypothetical protein
MRYTAHELPHTCNITPALENVKGIYKNIEKIKKIGVWIIGKASEQGFIQQ